MTEIRDIPTVPTRELSARSVVASTLLGCSPPELPVRTIVRCGQLFDISGSTIRTAISRMVADGSLTLDGDRSVYRVAGGLADRHARQAESRTTDPGPWDGTWVLAVVTATDRDARRRTDLRRAATTLRLAEVRAGVWLRPDNLAASRHPAARQHLDDQCDWFTTTPREDPANLAVRLWDLTAWSTTATSLIAALTRHLDILERDGSAALADGFVLAAAVERHLLADPILPTPLMPPRWPGADLRATYNDYDRTYTRQWRDWFRTEANRPST
jgi:phenylacetic acid degradation operon negative regulatory protein